MQPVQPKGRKECGASQFFHMDGHRIGAAKGLAPHARFGGLLFACDLPWPRFSQCRYTPLPENGFGA